MKGHGEGTAASFLKPMRPEYQQRAARLAVMDEQGIDSILLFPTFGVTFETVLRDDAEATFAAMTAFNQLAGGGLGLRRRRPHLRRAVALARGRRPGGRGARPPARARRAHGALERRSGERAQPRRSALRPVLVARRRSGGSRRLPRLRVRLQRALLDAVGALAPAALASHERLAERLLLHRHAAHAYARSADLRQRLRPLPRPQGRDDRVRRELGREPAPAPRQGADELHEALALDRRPACRSRERRVPRARAREPLPRGELRARSSSGSSPSTCCSAPTGRTRKGFRSRASSPSSSRRRPPPARSG